MIVSGDVTPDHYVVDKKDMKISDKEIKKQEWKLVKRRARQGENVKVNLTPEEQAQQKITDDDILFIWPR